MQLQIQGANSFQLSLAPSIVTVVPCKINRPMPIVKKAVIAEHLEHQSRTLGLLVTTIAVLAFIFT